MRIKALTGRIKSLLNNKGGPAGHGYKNGPANPRFGGVGGSWAGAGQVGTPTPVFFIVGRAKSGTSWLMRLLDAHPEIMCRGEGRFFGRSFKREDFKEAQGGRIQPSSLYRAILEAEYLRAWIERSVWSRGDDVEEHLANLTRLATNYFLTQRLSGSGKRIVGDKTPIVDPNVVREIGEICPEARIIHIVRDGRDAAVSIVHHRWNNARDEDGIYELGSAERRKRDAYRENPSELFDAGEGLFTEKAIRNMAVSWREQVGRVMRDGRTLPGGHYTEVRYEDLLESPEENLVRLLEFLGADTDDEVVRRCVESASFENWTEGRKRGEEDSASFFRKGVAGDWKNVFTGWDRRIFDEEAGGLLSELGYESGGDR
ncbi:MAG: sulfotransferase [Rubrobacteraceae bacterium]